MRLNRFLTVLLVFLIAFSAFSENRALKLKIKMPDGQMVSMYSGSYALIIGNSKYTNGWPSLNGVMTDVKLVREALEAKGFQVVVVENVTKPEMEKAFDDFIRKYGNDINNRLLFYFAGHGHTLKNAYGGDMGYIIPVDAPNPNYDKDGFMYKSMDMQMIEVYAKRIQSKHALFLFDSCFSGSIFALSRAVPHNINNKTLQPVRQFITSGGPDEEVPDKSIFREQFIAGINGEADYNKDGYITGVEIGEFLQNKVVIYSNDSQHPQYGKIRHPHLDKGDFVFIGDLNRLGLPDDGDKKNIKNVIEPPPPPVSVAGHLQVNVNVASAKVYLDGKYIGDASFDKALSYSNLPTGGYTVKVVSGSDTLEKTANIKLNTWEQMVFQFTKSQPLVTIKKDEKPVVELGQSVIFDEQFNDNSRLWADSTSNDVSYWVSGGRYHIDRKLSNKKSHCTWLGETIDTTKDFVISTKIARLSGKDNWGYGLFFGASDVNNAFRFEISGTGYYSLGEMVSGNWNDIIKWTTHYSIKQNNQDNVLEIAKRGDTLHLIINGTEVNSVPYRPFKGNNVGFCATDVMHISVDNLVIKNTSSKKDVVNPRREKIVKEPKIIIDEKFNDNSNNWSTSKYDEITYSVYGGKYHVDKKSSNTAHCTWLTKTLTTTGDYSITVDMNKISGVDNWGYGLMFGSNKASNSYRFEVSGNGQYIFGKVQDGKWITIVSWTTSGDINQGNATNTLRVSKTGSNLYFYVNGKYLTKSAFLGHYGSDVGFCFDSTMHVAVDDLIIREY